MKKKKKKQRRKSNSLAAPEKVSSVTFTHFFTRMRTALLLSGLVVLVFVIYSNSLNGPFIFDDMSNMEYNSHIRLARLTFDGLKQAVFESPASHRPVANISFALNYFFHGENTFGYHLVNILVHATAGIFLYFFIKITLRTPALCSKFENQKWIAFITVLIWLVHPVQTQSVTYIVQRMNSLAAMFYVLALFFYAKGRLSQTPRNRWLWFGGCALAGILSFGSKQTAATLPFFVLLYEWYFFQDLSWPWLKRHFLPVAGVMILLGALALTYLGVHPLETILSGYDSRDFTPLQRVLTQFRVVIFYISLLMFPHPSRLNLDRDFSLSHSLIDPFTTLLCLAAIAALVALACYLAKKYRLVSFSILWFLGNLVIESSVIGLEIIFDHRTYLPSMLLCLPAVAWLYPHLWRKWLGIGALAAVVTVFSFWTYERNGVFRDQITIWGDCVAKSPKKARPYNNLGIFLMKKGRIEEAQANFQRALQLKPEYASAHVNLGAVYARQRKYEKALTHYSEALRHRHNVPEAHYSMGNALVLLGRIDEALGHYQNALEIEPDYADVHLKLADVLDQKGRHQKAIAHYQEALRLSPDYVKAHNNLGATLASRGKLEEAISHFARVLEIRPNYAEAHFNMGNAKASQRKYEEAARHFSKALQVNPKDNEARRNLEKVQQLMKLNPAVRSDPRPSK
jgi:tetratricopeptide (TPR) repeat protein